MGQTKAPVGTTPNSVNPNEATKSCEGIMSGPPVNSQYKYLRGLSNSE